MDGRRGAVVEYRTATGEPVSYYVVPAPEGRPLAAGTDLRRASRAGYHVVGWTEPGLLHALVANLPESRLVELARLCMKEMEAVLFHPPSRQARVEGWRCAARQRRKAPPLDPIPWYRIYVATAARRAEGWR